MKIHKEQIAVLGARKFAQQRKDLLADFREKGLDANEESPGGDIVLRDKAGGVARLHGENDTV